jgi:spermidine synthase
VKPKLVLQVALALSGGAALLYEVAWTRWLTLFMGHTVAAASAVLAAFMGGLAAGAVLGGRLVARMSARRAFTTYAALELAIAALAIVLPYELAAVEPLLARAYAGGQGGAMFGVVRFACAVAVVTLPAIAMGATLPIVVHGSVDLAARAGREVGVLYAVNTLGAAAGAVLSGFVLLPALGIRATTWIAVVLNVAAAAAGWWLSNAQLAPSHAPERSKTPAAPRLASRLEARAIPQSHRALAAFALAISGAAALVQQIAWTRILALILGPTTYAFSATVATFLVGIAIGALAGAWLTRRGPSAGRLAAALLVSAAGALTALSLVPFAVKWIASAVAAPGASFGSIVRLQTTFVAALMLPMTVAFGAAFPLAVSLAVRSDRPVSSDVAVAYAANTVGAIAGALAGGFWLVPTLGLQGSVRAAAALATAGFIVITILMAAGGTAASRARKMLTAVAAVATASAAWFLPPWDRELVSSGAYKYASLLPADYRDALLGTGTLLYYREGAASTVSVRRLAGVTALAIDGKVDASNGGDMLTQRLLAHVPLLLHDAPRRVGLIGLGSGVTLASALSHPVDRVDVVEISREVRDASMFFARENRDALRDPRTRLIVGDGRTHLVLGRELYDVIISEPSNPWMAGIAALFTREFFEGAQRRLAPGGLLCQWAHTYDIRDTDLRSIVATFTSVFADAMLLLVGDGDVLLVGSREPIVPRLDAVRSGWMRPGVAADLADVAVTDPALIVSLVAGTRPDLERYSSGARWQSDDRLSLEFTGPRGLYESASQATARALRLELAAATLPPIVRQAQSAIELSRPRGAMLLRAEAAADAFDEFVRALGGNPRDYEAASGLLQAAAQAGRVDAAERALGQALQSDPRSLEAALALSRLRASRGDFAGAADLVREDARRAHPDPRALEQLASVAADAGDTAALDDLVQTLAKGAPDKDSTRYYTAELHVLSGRLDQALQVAMTLDQRGERHARCQNLLGALFAETGRSDDARRAFAAAIEADPRDPTGYMNLGSFELHAGHAQAALRFFAEALTLDPASAAVKQALDEAAAAAGRKR